MNEGNDLYTGAVTARNDLWWRKMRNYIFLGVGVVIIYITKASSTLFAVPLLLHDVISKPIDSSKVGVWIGYDSSKAHLSIGISFLQRQYLISPLRPFYIKNLCFVAMISKFIINHGRYTWPSSCRRQPKGRTPEIRSEA